MLHAFLHTTRLFSDAEIAEIAALFTRRELRKGEAFVREGQRCTEVAFVESGVFRSYYTSEAGEEMTYCFRFPGDLMAAYSSFISGNESRETMEAIGPAVVHVIRKADVDRLAELPSWIHFLKNIAENEYMELENRLFQLQRVSALTRYQTLLEKQPEYVRLIPLQFLASYLGVTQRHLSRIRRQLAFGQMS
ncbi:Crp/Fnr family transcriptional regulator [Siphonobacter aquaeclarae]|uniref:cAMP-binding domain of CRP or a regulatory subunit of cAMP-dependent protein kinases n=1 Tax=Siphonobacter aquaeclarae TaxID=563176 RepID=A0A1G9RFB5_9BACT|nr:Crp/Fnr family transcriptional regulator [Siphonobacter aquaeclarae]SDM21958.1 cAMP-binding domain of CRP or a regulatory subunit of cAMP-dependent protein kinases [Siphonobacter aquaeclarae]